MLPTLLVILEAKWGPSRLQIFDAILSHKIFASHVSLLWWCIIIWLTAFPLGLSVAYKRFLGGTATVELNPLGGRYGINFPSIGSWAPLNDPIYWRITAYAPFWQAVSNGSFPSAEQLPSAYGYNTFVLNSMAAALLDVPMPDYISNMKSRLLGDETWHVSAQIDGYLATLNSSYKQLRDDDCFRKASIASSPDGLTASYLYKDKVASIGMTAGAKMAQSWMSLYYNGTAGWSIFDLSVEDNDVDQFRKTAQLYDIRRRRFNVQWQINQTSIILLSGSLAKEAAQKNVDQTIVYMDGYEPYTIDAMPDLPHNFEQFVDSPDSTWLQPSYAMTIATAYWARALYLIIQDNSQYDWSYTTSSETIWSTRSTLEACPPLFLVLLIQPIITIAAFTLIILFYRTPIDKGFGMISILAGVDKSTITLLHGTGLSGSIRRPITLNITTQATEQSTSFGEAQHGLDTKAHTNYHLSTRPRKYGAGTIVRNRAYS